MSRPAELVDGPCAEAPTVEVTEPGLDRPAGRPGPRRHEPLPPRPLSPHSGPGARPPADPAPRLARRRRRAALVAGAGALLAGLVGLAASATAVPTGESWGAELAVSGGDDVNVRLVDGAVRLGTPSTARTRSEGVMVLAPRRPAAPTNAITTKLTRDLPPGTAARVDVRGMTPKGTWGRWIPTRDDVRTVLPSTTTQVQARIVLQGGAGAVSPAVERLWITTSTTTAAPATGTAPVVPSTTAAPPVPVTTVPTKSPQATTTTSPSGEPGPKPRPTTPTTSSSGAKPTDSQSPSAAPAPPPANPSVVKPIWDSDITGQSLGMFKDTPWNFVGAPKPSVVPATDLPGLKALKFTMPGGGQRAEIEPNVDNFTEGQDRYFRMTVRLAPGFPVNTDTWQLITQFKNEGDGSPPLELRVGNGNYVLSGGADAPGGSKNFDQTIAPAVVGKVTTLVLHVKFSSKRSEGVVDAWVDGQKKVSGFHPPAGTLYSGDSSYWKLGLYRDRSIDQTATYELSDARVGESLVSMIG